MRRPRGVCQAPEFVDGHQFHDNQHRKQHDDHESRAHHNQHDDREQTTHHDQHVWHDRDDAASSAAGADGAVADGDELPGGGPALDALEWDRIGLQGLSEAHDRYVLHLVDAARRHARLPGPGHDGERIEHVLLWRDGLQPRWHVTNNGDGAGEHADVPGGRDGAAALGEAVGWDERR